MENNQEEKAVPRYFANKIQSTFGEQEKHWKWLKLTKTTKNYFWKEIKMIS